MLDQQWLQFVVALCLLLPHSGLQAGYPVVGRTAGTLAVQPAPDADWRVIAPGGILPDIGEARTSATGPGQLQSEQGTLSLGTLSEVKYDLTARQATLLSGRVFVVPSTDKPWTIQTRTSRVVIPPGSSVEVVNVVVGTLVVTALKGPAEVTVPGSGPVTVAERTIGTFPGTPLKTETKPLEPAAEKHLSAWTKQLPPGQGVGQLVIKDSHGGTGTRLNIARYHAEVVMQPPIALVKLDQSFYNPSSRQEEGEFIFNLPPGASVSRFAMFVTKDQLIEGEVIERKRADEVYTTIVRSKRDPAILEQIGDNLFKMRVFPIFPKDIKRILLDFTLPLDGRSGQYQLQLPLLSNLLPIWDFKLFGAIRGPTPFASAQCPTIPGLKFVSQGPNEITFNFERSNYQPVSDLVVAFQQPTPQTATTFRQLRAMPLSLPALVTNNANEIAAALHPDGVIRAGLNSWNLQSGIYFQADLPVPANIGHATPADVLLLVDTSSNGTLDQVRPALQTTLASLRPDDRFRLVCVDAVARPMHEGWLQTRSPEAAAAYQNFEQQICLGATDMLASCQAVARQLADHDPARRPIVIYIGDGLHAVKNGDLSSIADRCAEEITKSKAAFFTINVLPLPAAHLRPPQRMNGGGFTGQGIFQFGGLRNQGWNGVAPGSAESQTSPDGRLFLTRLTQGAGGRSYDFTDAQADRARLIEWLLSGLPTPTRIENFKIAGCDSIDVYHPANLLPGEPFRIVGRKIGSVDKLEIAYQIKGVDGALQPQNIVLTPAANDEDHLVGRFWATQRLRHLQRLLAAPIKGGGNPDASKVIVALSREWSLLTPQTAFLVLETEADYERWSVPRQGRRRYWSTDDTPAVQPLPADWLLKVKPLDLELARAKVTGVTEVDDQLEAARKAVEAHNYELASRILDKLQKHQVALTSDLYRNLQRIVSQRQRIALEALGLKQGWFDPDRVHRHLPTGTDRLLTNFGTITTELLERHPFAEQLLQEITLPAAEMTLRDFAQFLKTTLGVNIFVDTVKLQEESVDAERLFKLPQLKKLSAMNATKHVLDQFNLTLVEEPRRLVITTKTEGIAARRRVLFPIQDLVAKDPKFDLNDIQDPVFDREQQFLERLEAKLKKLTTIHLRDASLSDLVARLQRELDENILIDTARLEEERVAPDATDITCEYDNAPVGDVLTWLLDTKNLTYSIEHEAILLTTKTAGIAKRPALVYPAHGILFRDARPGRQQPRPQWGGWGMGGMGGSMGGGLGGAFDLVRGGGGGFGDSNVGPSPMLEAFSSNTDESAPAQTGNTEPNQANDVSGMQMTDDPFEHYGGNAGDILMGVQQQTGGPPDSPWMEADGEGGNAAFFYPSLCFAFRQTREAHQEIAEYFRQQRALQTRRGTNPNMVPIASRDALSRNELDVQTLMMLIQNLTGGPPDSPWFDSDGEGGAIAYDRPRMALSVRQTTEALDEVSAMLVRLRRERYFLMHQSRPWEHSISVGRASGLFDGPWFAKMSDAGELVGPANLPELTALRVRRDLPAGRWTWMNAEQTKSSELTLATAADRLQLTWTGWEVRLRGDQAAVYAPQLQYAELGTWGSAVRDWLDAELIFWPHRSNRDLATMFDVVVVPADKQDRPNHVRLQFTPNKLERQPVWIHILYDKTTGLPVVWEAFRQSLLVQRFRFQPELTEGQLVRLTVRQESHDGKLLGSGEWTPATQAAAPIADPTTFPEGTLTIDQRPQARAAPTSFEIGWQLLRKGDTALAEAEFRKILEQYPNHPLAQFLLAWSLQRQLPDVPQERLQAAYAAVIQNGPSELARSLIRLETGRLTERQLYDLLQRRPVDKRDLPDEVTLAKLSLQLSAPDAALTHARRAWQLHPAAVTPRLEVAQLILQSQLKLGDLAGALASYESWRQERQLTVTQLIQLLETFEYFDRASDIPHLYQELLQSDDPAITIDLRRSLLKRYANATVGLMRWKALLTLFELLPTGSSDAQFELSTITSELITNRDPVPVAALAQQAKSPATRQELQSIQANVTPDLAAAQQLYWQLHQEGYLFHSQPLLVSDRLREAKHPEQAVAIFEALVKGRRLLSSQERHALAEAYRESNRPLDAQRASSE